jgi:hypothetical protein
VPSVQSAFLILFIHGLALPLGMTKDPASGVIKTEHERREADSVKNSWCRPLQDDTLPPCWTQYTTFQGVRKSIPANAQDLVDLSGAHHRQFRLPLAGLLYPKASVTLRAMYGRNSSIRAQFLMLVRRASRKTAIWGMLWIEASNRLNDSSEQSEMAGPSWERGTNQ